MTQGRFILMHTKSVICTPLQRSCPYSDFVIQAIYPWCGDAILTHGFQVTVTGKERANGSAQTLKYVGPEVASVTSLHHGILVLAPTGIFGLCRFWLWNLV